MYRTLILALILTVILANMAPKSHRHSKYEAWKKKHGMKFEESEERYRMFLFHENDRDIKEHNKNKANTWKQGHNQFSALTLE